MDTSLEEAAIGMCSDPGSNEMVSGSWNKLDRLSGSDQVKLSTSEDSTGEWQWASGMFVCLFDRIIVSCPR